MEPASKKEEERRKGDGGNNGQNKLSQRRVPADLKFRGK